MPHRIRYKNLNVLDIKKYKNSFLRVDIFSSYEYSEPIVMYI